MRDSLLIIAQPYQVNFVDINHMTYGNFIGVTYVLEKLIDISLLRQAWEKLQKQFPPLAGRYDERTKSIGSFSPLELIERPSTLTVSEFNRQSREQPLRSKFITEPGRRAVLAGRAPLASLTVTKLADQGCVLGLAINHVITDAGGFHKLARQLSEIYNALLAGQSAPVYDPRTKLPEFHFGTHRNWRETKLELSKQNIKAPLPMQGLMGFTPYNLILWSMKKITAQQRLHIHLSPGQVQKLKDTALKATGEDWVSTNAALCGHFTAIMIDLIHDGNPQKAVRIGQLLDLRSRYFEDTENRQKDFIGNAILIHTQEARMDTYDRESLTRFFKSMVSELTPEFLRRRLDVIADSLRHGRTYPGLEMSSPLLAVNNQTKMPVYDLSFGGQFPADIIPQDVGDNIMFFPAKDGGVDVYIRDILNPKRQARLEKPEWQKRIYDF